MPSVQLDDILPHNLASTTMARRLILLALLGCLVSVLAAATQHTLQLKASKSNADSEYHVVTHPEFSGYSLRLKTPTLCDDSVKQYSGYLDINEDRHLFFWFFESRSNPASDPLVMWLSGGPGCSSSTGLLFELGPCSIQKDPDNGTVYTTRNEYSWNTQANVFFLDQPANVGYSFTTGGKNVTRTTEAAEDVYAFLQLFFARFQEYAQLPFHIAAESYGGHYAPHIGSIIHRRNKELADSGSPTSTRHINLESIMLGNALVDPLIQMPSMVEYVCDGAFALFEPWSPTCLALRANAPVCKGLIQGCYTTDSWAPCTPATLYCWQALYTPAALKSGKNIYDIRRPCDRLSGENPICYEEIAWVEEYMARPDVRSALGADPRAPPFAACNYDMNVAFMYAGDGMRDSYRLLPELVDEGVRLLIYAGDVDMLCNYLGELKWISALESTHWEAFNAAPFLPWTVSGRSAGVVHQAGTGAGNVTYARVCEAGHMVPHDQPAAALDMLIKWINNIPIAS
ncbi:Serine carboxypeptidase [Mycena kentingensis (nom. inval.)]|nr:Serine carboxypeptidase [Mycena kentingensis (nom. inval.)]